MTTEDYKAHLSATREIIHNAKYELDMIKKDKLQLSTRVRIERAVAGLEAAKVNCNLNIK